jgi:hypothetical protein
MGDANVKEYTITLFSNPVPSLGARGGEGPEPMNRNIYLGNITTNMVAPVPDDVNRVGQLLIDGNPPTATFQNGIDDAAITIIINRIKRIEPPAGPEPQPMRDQMQYKIIFHTQIANGDNPNVLNIFLSSITYQKVEGAEIDGKRIVADIVPYPSNGVFVTPDEEAVKTLVENFINHREPTIPELPAVRAEP